MNTEKSPSIAIAIMKKAQPDMEKVELSEEERIASSEVMDALKGGNEEAFADALKGFIELCHGG